MKRYLFLLMVGVLTLPALSRDFIYQFEKGRYLPFRVLDEKAKTCGVIRMKELKHLEGELTIPSTARDEAGEIYTVVAICPDAFLSSSLTNVVIPSTVTEIGDDAFQGSKNLTEISIPNSVTHIGGGALSDTGLRSVRIPESIDSLPEAIFNACDHLTSITTGPITYIGKYAFSYCKSLTSIEIPETVNSIGMHAFAYCTSLTHISLPKSITSISPGTFIGCSSLTSVTMPDSLNSIEDGAFSSCTALESIAIPNLVDSIGIEAFGGCSLLSYIEIPNSVIFIGGAAFRGCSSLSSIYLPNSLTEINSYTFHDCTNLKSIMIPNTVTTIREMAFMNCNLLSSIVLPNAITYIDHYAFYGCSNLATIIMGNSIKFVGGFAFGKCPTSEVYITTPEPPEAFAQSFESYSGKLYVQDEYSAELYRKAPICWNTFDIEVMIVPETMEGNTDVVLSGDKGTQIQLTATLLPENVSLPQIFWRSTNPSIATVDNNGLVTLMTDIDNIFSRAGDEVSCKIIAESLYADGPTLEYTVIDTSGGIEDINSDSTGADIDYTLPYEVFNMSGIRVSATTEGLAPGLYIIRQGKSAMKIIVK